MTAVLIYLIAFVVLISVITIIHESGHFFAARICRVKVLDFSIGMGPSILQKQDKHQTNYNIRILPIGGFVQMLGEGENSAEKDSFQSKPYHQRLFIVLAGPMANFILAFMIFAGLNLYGIQEISSDIGQVKKDSPAYNAGIESGTKIKRIDESFVETRMEVQSALLRRLGETGIINIETEDFQGTTSLHQIYISEWLKGQEPNDLMRDLGMYLPSEIIIAQMTENGPAENSGLMIGDKINAIDFNEIQSWEDLKFFINSSEGKEILVSISRNNSNFDYLVQPEYRESPEPAWLIGIAANLKILPSSIIKKRYGLLEGSVKAFKDTYSKSIESLIFLKKMVQGLISPRNLGGPVMIGQYAGDSIKYGGLFSFLMLMALISIGLGIINLLPIPVLDGGQAVMMTLEKIKGSPLSENFVGISYRLGIAFIVCLMIFTFFNDLSRIF
jgi:regulator of sigma E protease